jgi:hypothetical protein
MTSKLGLCVPCGRTPLRRSRLYRFLPTFVPVALTHVQRRGTALPTAADVIERAQALGLRAFGRAGT